MNKVCSAIFIHLLLWGALPAAGQELPMAHYTTDDGLPSNNVYQAYRDSKGFLWFGTDKGVARYNGIKFDIFTTFNGLPDNEVFLFREDLYGRLWMGTFNGELCYYKDDTFHTAANTPFLKLPYKSEHVRSITPQTDSSIIVVYNNNSRFLNIHHHKCTFINTAGIDSRNEYGFLFYRKKLTPDRYRLTFCNAALIIDTNGHIKQKLAIDTFNIIRSANNNNNLYTSCQDQEYVYNHSVVYTPDMKLVKRLPAGFDREYFIHQLFCRNGNIFYATNRGLFINDTVHVLKDVNISSVTADNTGNYWATTLNDGVYMMPGELYTSRLYKDIYKGKAAFAHAANSSVFFATANNNLYELNNKKLSTVLSYSNVKQRSYNVLFDASYLVDDSNRYYNIYDHDFITINDLFSPKPVVQHNGLYDGVKCMLKAGGYVYLKRRSDVLRCRPGNKGEMQVKYEYVNTPAKGERIFGFAKDVEDHIWFSTLNGVYKIYDTTAVLQPQYKNLVLRSFEFSGKYLVGCTQDNKLVMCTARGSGLDVEHVPEQNCIWDKFYKLDDGHLLISTNNYYRMLATADSAGVSRHSLTVIDHAFVPLQAEAICAGRESCYFFKDGQITAIAPGSLMHPSPPPALYFTTLSCSHKSCIIKDEVIVSFADSRNMTVSFATLSFSGSKVAYQYAVSKYGSDNWVDVNGEDISLINSGYGNYTIKIRARTLSSDYSRPIEFTLQIMRPFWASWWFIAFGLCMAGVLVVVISRQRLMAVLRKKDTEHQMQVRFMRSEYKALNALMNPHFIFNTLNNVQGLINKNDKVAANEYLRVIADLIRQNMHNISKELIPLQKEVDLITNYLLLEKLRFKDKLNYSIIIEKDLDLSDIMVPPLMVQPLIENSIKHGILPLESPEGAIYMNIYERKGTLYIEVRDNGVGLNHASHKPRTEHESFGLENVRKRIEQLSIIQNKQITFNFSERRNTIGKLQWTIVTITMPIN